MNPQTLRITKDPLLTTTSAAAPPRVFIVVNFHLVFISIIAQPFDVILCALLPPELPVVQISIDAQLPPRASITHKNGCFFV